jgi:hypothetical protein
MTVPTAGDGEVTIAVPPLNVSPVRVGPVAAALAMAGWGTAAGVAALVSATGAAIASAVMTPVAKAARLLIGLERRSLRCVGMASPKVEMFLMGRSIFIGVPYL